MQSPVAQPQPCIQCRKEAQPVFYMGLGTPRFRGWYCPSCGYFDAAIGRERKLMMEIKR